MSQRAKTHSEIPLPSLRNANASHARQENEEPFGALAYFAVLVTIFGLATGLSLYRLWKVPEYGALYSGTDSDLHFSEDRALRHVRELTDIGVRLVGQIELDTAADYLLTQGELLIEKAAQSRPDLIVKVGREFVSGAVETTFLNNEYINFYNNLTNVVLAISPRARSKQKAVLVNAHFDSTLGSVGASDDASCVGVMLEVARVLIMNPAIKLAGPVVFLMNGAEEALCPASHGFMQQSPWAKNLGVFLNLESTGPLGPDFVFQNTGRWPIQAFAAVAPFPRGSVVAQDFFEFGLVPADTDYRMFSANMQGALPGIDTAFLLGAGMYHTDRDVLDNIRQGTVQAMGQNALALIEELARQLAAREMAGKTEIDTEKAIYFDVLGIFMVVYPFNWAKVLHQFPLVIALSLPFIHKGAFPGRSLPNIYACVLLEALACFASIISAVAASLFFSILRVTSLGGPMSWYGQDAFPFAILVPAALGGLLLPYLGRRIQPKTAAMGNTLAHSLLASSLTHFRLGASFVPVLWSAAGIITMTDLEPTTSQLSRKATISCVWPIIVLLPNALALSMFVLQKSSFMGAQGQPDYNFIAVDAVAGGVIGLMVVSLTGFLTPWIAFASGKGLRRSVLLLFCISILFAVQASLGLRPYTSEAPKKIFLQHLHEHDSAGRPVRSVFAVGSVDSIPVDSLLQKKDTSLWAAQRSGWEWLTTYPLNEAYINSLVLQAPLPSKGAATPRLDLVDRSTSKHSTDSQRLSLQLQLPGHGLFGCMNISGPILDWSLPALRQGHQKPGQMQDRFVRFVGSGSEKHWRFWVEIPAGETLSVMLAAADPKQTTELQEFIHEWPDWTSVVSITTFSSSWTF